MNPAVRFWEEELRSYPLGGGQTRIWVVRCDAAGEAAALRLLFTRSLGGDAKGPTPTPPLTQMLRAVDEGRPRIYKDPRDGPNVLRVLPIGGAEEPAGACALSHPSSPPWNEAVRLWAERFAARTGMLLPHLPAEEGCACGGSEAPTLFPVEPWVRGEAPKPPAVRPATPRGVSLPHPSAMPGTPGLIGVSREMEICCDTVRKVAASGVNVLLHGESGTGKEMLARALHQNSPRRNEPFIGVNCASLPESLFESELFGHKAGAFTGAAREKTGLLEAADGGTFFLDEIGDMPQALQIKLLRVMQERRLRRIGELQTRPVDVRFVAASHKDLQHEIDAGRFRLDLYYRLKVVQVVIPPLRRRPEDIIPLAAWFLGRHEDRNRPWRITEDAVAALQRYRWPGNVRELENEVRRWLALWGERDLIEVEHLSAEVQRAAGRAVDPGDLLTLRTIEEANELLERYLIRKALSVCGGLKSAAARRLGLSRQGLYKKIRRHGMDDLLQRT